MIRHAFFFLLLFVCESETPSYCFGCLPACQPQCPGMLCHIASWEDKALPLPLGPVHHGRDWKQSWHVFIMRRGAESSQPAPLYTHTLTFRAGSSTGSHSECERELQDTFSHEEDVWISPKMFASIILLGNTLTEACICNVLHGYWLWTIELLKMNVQRMYCNPRSALIFNNSVHQSHLQLKIMSSQKLWMLIMHLTEWLF